MLAVLGAAAPALPQAAGRVGGLQPEAQTNATLPTGSSHARAWDKSIDLLQRNAALEKLWAMEMGTPKDVPQKTEGRLTCAPVRGAPPAVALMYAMDVRLPPEPEACSASQRARFDLEGDASCRSRAEHIAALNAASEGTHVFFQTDRNFEPDVRNFTNVVATAYSDELGGLPSGIDPVAIQWWRLKQVWKLLSDYEFLCAHQYEFVIKMRTDANLIGTRPFTSWYLDRVKPRYDLANTAFLMSDRVFAASRDGMRRLASFYGDSYYQGLCGICSKCGPFLTALVAAGTTSFAVNVPVTGVARAPKCEAGCFTTPAGSRLCPLYHPEKEDLERQVSKSAFWKYKRLSLAQTRNQQLDPSYATHAKLETNDHDHACVITTMWSSSQQLASEPAFVMHALRNGFHIETLSSVEPGMFSTKRQGLMLWRHGTDRLGSGPSEDGAEGTAETASHDEQHPASAPPASGADDHRLPSREKQLQIAHAAALASSPARQLEANATHEQVVGDDDDPFGLSHRVERKEKKQKAAADSKSDRRLARRFRRSKRR